MLISKKNRKDVYKYLFKGECVGCVWVAAGRKERERAGDDEKQIRSKLTPPFPPPTEGVLTAVKDYNLPEHPDVPGVPNLQVIKLMQSLKSKEYVSERFAWRHYYWFLTDEGIEHLREVLALPADIVPATLKKSTRALERDARGGGGGDRDRGDRGDRPPRRESGPGGYRGGAGRGAGGDKEVAPGAYRPSFGRGAGAPAP